MNLSVGIVGLPNVGKSTLFNALLRKQQAFVANYPFATIEPNVGVVPVPDPRLEKLAEVVAGVSTSEESGLRKLSLPPSEVTEKRPPIVPATVKFIDIAGLVKGAAEGAGLGSKFLSHIREVNMIAHVVRVFEDENVVKKGNVDPKADYQTINTELILADLETISKIPAKRDLASRDKTQSEIVDKVLDALDKDIPVRSLTLSEEEQEVIKNLSLLSAKPEIIILNVAEKDYSSDKTPEIIREYSEVLNQREENFEVVSAKIESELSDLSEEDQRQYLKDLGLVESGLERLIKKAYKMLGLISFFTTTGEKEIRAWTIRKGEIAKRAAGEVHTDFEKKFIKAEVVSYEDFVRLGGWKKAREVGKTRLEGRDYIMQDGDVVEFKIGQ